MVYIIVEKKIKRMLVQYMIILFTQIVDPDLFPIIHKAEVFLITIPLTPIGMVCTSEDRQDIRLRITV